MTKAELFQFIRGHKYGVQASISATGAPQAAVVGLIVTPELELFFDTLTTSRKCHNLRRDPRFACVIGWDDARTVQYEGIADEPHGSELEQLAAAYFEAFPDGLERRQLPDITYFRARPRWIRYSDFRSAEPRIVEFEFE
jgi:general stress protein 26